MEQKRLQVAVLGGGIIGTDLWMKCRKSARLELVAVVGRNLDSPGSRLARDQGVLVSDEGIRFFSNHPRACDSVFDATSASDHLKHAPLLAELGVPVVNLTPARVGTWCVPSINLAEAVAAPHVSLVTCGGQGAIPVAKAMVEVDPTIDYIEIANTVASSSVGPATRYDLDDYLLTTELGIRRFTSVARTKALTTLNPAVPAIDMQVTVYAKTRIDDADAFRTPLASAVEAMRAYVPGCVIASGPTLRGGCVSLTLRIRGAGDYLPSFAGNLDIINCAAVAVAEGRAAKMAS